MNVTFFIYIDSILVNRLAIIINIIFIYLFIYFIF